jgi:hypothetical protein
MVTERAKPIFYETFKISSGKHINAALFKKNACTFLRVSPSKNRMVHKPVRFIHTNESLFGKLEYFVLSEKF